MTSTFILIFFYVKYSKMLKITSLIHGESNCMIIFNYGMQVDCKFIKFCYDFLKKNISDSTTPQLVQICPKFCDISYRPVTLYSGYVETYISHKNNVKMCTSWQNIKSILKKPRNKSNTSIAFNSNQIKNYSSCVQIYLSPKNFLEMHIN